MEITTTGVLDGQTVLLVNGKHIQRKEQVQARIATLTARIEELTTLLTYLESVIDQIDD
jgi:hypothetical protein